MTPMQISKRGIVLIYSESGAMFVDFAAMYVDDLLDCFDSYKSGSLKDHCRRMFQKELEDVENSGAMLPKELKERTIMQRKQLCELLETEDGFDDLLSLYRADPKGIQNSLLTAIKAGSRCSAAYDMPK